MTLIEQIFADLGALKLSPKNVLNTKQTVLNLLTLLLILWPSVLLLYLR